jgi:flagellar export protein FliJ
MIQRLKTVSKISRIIDHQKEVIEFQLGEITHRQTLELERLSSMENELHETIDRFEKSLQDRFILNSEEVAFLFGMASTFFQKMEQKKREIEKIEKELEALKVIFLEAYRKKKAVEIVQNKIVGQERRAEAVVEQKNIDYLTLSSRSRQ